MIKKSVAETAPKAKRTESAFPKKIPRRKEWRFELPLQAVVVGQLPRGKKFREETKIRNISSTGAYLHLEANVVVCSKLNLIILIPKQATEGKNVRLNIEGTVVRVEKPRKTSKKQGVAVHFTKDYHFIVAAKRP